MVEVAKRGVHDTYSDGSVPCYFSMHIQLTCRDDSHARMSSKRGLRTRVQDRFRGTTGARVGACALKVALP